ncbi:hypothetical protein FRC17_009194 [Serendipita sp. 399]|nr:hypothetical protein FRC17_009194 [Serendipita sp. 399]
MKTLPDDVLLEIFDVYTSIYGLDQSPVKLLRISKHVRELVMATSHLWSSVRISLYSAQERESLLSSTGLEAYLAISERVAYPIVLLDITISYPTGHERAPMTDSSVPEVDRSAFPHLEALECRNGIINIGESTAPKLGYFTVKHGWLFFSRKMPQLCHLTIEKAGGSHFELNWTLTPNLATLEVFDGVWRFPRSNSAFHRLSTIILHSEVTREQFTGLGQFDASSPLDTLTVYDLQPSKITSYLHDTPLFRFKTLKITAKDARLFQSLTSDPPNSPSPNNPDDDSDYDLAQELLRIVDSRGGILQVLEEKYIEDGASVREAASRKIRRFL